MAIHLHAPSLPIDSIGDFSGARRLLGHLAAALFVVAVGYICAKVITFEPASTAECLPEICGPAQAS